MGMIQSGFNQALTGATFLLQQTPMYKQAVEQQIINTQAKKLSKQNQDALNKMGQADERLGDVEADLGTMYELSEIENKPVNPEEEAQLMQEHAYLKGAKEIYSEREAKTREGLVNMPTADTKYTKQALQKEASIRGQKYMPKTNFERALEQAEQDRISKAQTEREDSLIDRATTQLAKKFMDTQSQKERIAAQQEALKKHDEINRMILGGGN